MDKVKCIVVGAGPSGSACAYTLAKKGIEVVLLERGRTPGEKNVAAFVLITPVLDYLIPDWRERAPLERRIRRYDTVSIGRNDIKEFRDTTCSEAPVVFSAFRGKLDAWFAQEAVNAGAELITGMTVTDLIFDNNKVVGVKVGDEELYADIIVGADGIHSIVAEKSGLVTERNLEKCNLGVKEILDLPPEVINQRFQLQDGEGCIKEGYVDGDMPFEFDIYTNTDSLSFSVYTLVEDLKDAEIKLHEQLEKLKKHPYINYFLEGSKLREYQAHIHAEPQRLKPETMYGNGVLLCGEAAQMIDPGLAGVPVGMLSGMMAAETIEMAIEKNDYSSKTLRNYIKFLDSTSLWSTMYGAGRVTDYLYEILYGENKKIGTSNREVIDNIIIKDANNYCDYITREPYPFWKNMYLQVGRDHTPFFIRWIITGWVHTHSFCFSLAGKIKKRFRSRYYEWKR